MNETTRLHYIIIILNERHSYYYKPTNNNNNPLIANQAIHQNTHKKQNGTPITQSSATMVRRMASL